MIEVIKSATELKTVELKGLQAFTRFLRTLQPKNGSRKIWLKIGNNDFYQGTWDNTGQFDITKTVKLDEQDPKSRRSVGVSRSAYSFLSEQAELLRAGIFYIPTQPDKFPLSEFVQFTDNIACELDDHGSFENQLKLYEEFYQVTGLEFSSLLTSGGKSVHSHIKTDEHYAVDIMLFFRLLYVVSMQADPTSLNLHQPMRIPGFMGSKTEQVLLYSSDRKHTLQELTEGFQKWFAYRGWDFPDTICAGFNTVLVQTIKSKVWSTEQKNEKLKQIFARGNDYYQKKEVEKAELKKEINLGSLKDNYLSSFSQAVLTIDEVNQSIDMEDFGVDYLEPSSSTHARCGCPFHDSVKHNSAWIDSSLHGAFVFHCTVCFHNYADKKGLSYFDFWRVKNKLNGEFLTINDKGQRTVPPMPQGIEWYKLVEKFLEEHNQDTTFLYNKASDSISQDLYNKFTGYFDNLEIEEALTKVCENCGIYKTASDLDTFLQDLLIAIGIVLDEKSVKKDQLYSVILAQLGITKKTLNTVLKESKKVINSVLLRKKQLKDKTEKKDIEINVSKTDYLVNKSVLESVNIQAIYRSEEGAKGVYKWSINACYIFDLFQKYYEKRLKKVKRGEEEPCILFYENIKGTSAYVWEPVSYGILNAKLWQFARILMKLNPLDANDHESLLVRCNGHFRAILSQYLCELKPTKFDESFPIVPYRCYLNGVYSIEERKLVPYNPEIKNTYVLPFDFIPNATDKSFQFFKEWLTASIADTVTDKDKKTLSDFVMDAISMATIGYATKLKSFLWLVAKSNSGKSSFTKVIQSIVDPRLTPIGTIRKHNIEEFPSLPKRSAVENKMLFDETRQFKNNVFEEAFLIYIDDKLNLNASEVEELKGMVTINAMLRNERKGVKADDVFQKALIIFSTESDPQLNFGDKGGVNRLVLFDFKRLDDWKERLDAFTDDPNYFAELDSYIVANTIPDVIEAKYESLPESVKRRQDRYRLDNNPVTQFIEICLDFSNSESIETSKVVYEMYRYFDENCAKYAKTENAISKKIKPDILLMGAKAMRKRINSEQLSVFEGVRLRPWAEISEYLHADRFNTLEQIRTIYHEAGQLVGRLYDKIEIADFED